MRLGRSFLTVVVAGVLTFGIVYGLLTVLPKPQGPQNSDTVQTRAADSYTPKIDSRRIAVALPVGGAEPLMRGLQAGDRVNVVASVADPQTGRPLTAVVTRGATLVLVIHYRELAAQADARIVLGDGRVVEHVGAGMAL